jgi:hypothetical protein
LDIPGLQALYALNTGLDVVSFPDWCNWQEAQGTSYGASEEAAIEEALLQARKQGMILINYPQNQVNQGTRGRAILPSMPVCFLQLPEEQITLSPTASVQQIIDQVNRTVKSYRDASSLHDYITAQTILLSTHGWYLYYDPSADDLEGAYTVIPLDRVQLRKKIPSSTVQYTLADASFLNSLKNQVRNVTKTLDTSKKVYSATTIEARQVAHEISVLLSELKVHGLFLEETPSMMTTLLKRAKDSFFSKIEPCQEELLAMDEADVLSTIGDEIGTVLDAVLSERNISYTQTLLLCCSEDVDLFLREPQALSCITGNGINAQHCVYHNLYDRLHSALEQAFDEWYQAHRGEKSEYRVQNVRD